MGRCPNTTSSHWCQDWSTELLASTVCVPSSLTAASPQMWVFQGWVTPFYGFWVN